MIKRIKLLISELTYEFNSKNTDIKIEIVEELPRLIELTSNSLDHRLHDPIFFESSISIVCKNKISNSVTASMSIFLIEKNFFSKIKFWYLNQDEYVLQNITLKEILNQDYNFAMTIGYLKKFDDNNFFRIASFYFNMNDVIISEVMKNYTFNYSEIMGKENLSNKLLEKSILGFNMFNSSNLGVTRVESKAAEKHLILNGWNKMTNVFNRRTLGPVFSKKLENF